MTRGVPEQWIEHRRADGERVGWIEPAGEGFRAYDVLGLPVAVDEVDWIEAEELLEERGIGFLAERFLLRREDDDGRVVERPVRISEASPAGIVVIADEFGAAAAGGADADVFRLPFPAPAALRRL